VRLSLAGYKLIVTEKPDAAARIATALDINGKPGRKVLNGIPYYEAEKDRKHLVVVPALGHLYTVTGEKGTQGKYPVFSYRWVPLYVAERGAKRVRVWLETIAKLAKDATEFVDACDFDVEGSIIGYTILKYACGGKDAVAKRMKYSTLTREELEQSYADMMPTLDFCLIEAGLARHEVDWLYGINLSRALTQSAKKQTGRYMALSTGRVQGPTLKFVATREKAIRSFTPTPYWTVTATVQLGNALLGIPYEKGVIQTKAEADEIVTACNGRNGIVENVEIHRLSIPPPPPFDLGTLQNEAYRLFRYTPMLTLKTAQRLYLDALISYPRTGSQKLPPPIGYREILSRLAKSGEHGRPARELLAKPELKPREGKAFDSAHPAIYPTGNLSESRLDSVEKNVWDLIVKRFMAAFSCNAVQQTTKANVNINGNRFLLRGCETLEEGWLRIYKPYAHTFDTNVLPLIQGQEIGVQKVASKQELTKPPPRYNPSSLLKRMQQANLGTKATRAGIIQTLYDRKYIKEEKIAVTDLGFQVIDVLMKHCPTVLSSSLTAELEEKMIAIQEQKQTRKKVLAEAIEILKPAAEKLKENEDVIGRKLAEALKNSDLEERTIGRCPFCKTGNLVILRSKKTGKRFVGCTNYFKSICKTAFPLPQKGAVKPLRTACKRCGLPTVRVWQRGRRSWTLCLNPNCPSKKEPMGKMKGVQAQNAPTPLPVERKV
jgi:DNA topoisomerase-1